MTLNLRSVHWFPSQRRLHSCGIPAHQYTAPFVVLRKLTRAPLASLTTSTDRLTSAEARVQIEQRAPIAPEFTRWLHGHREHELRATAVLSTTPRRQREYTTSCRSPRARLSAARAAPTAPAELVRDRRRPPRTWATRASPSCSGTAARTVETSSSTRSECGTSGEGTAAEEKRTGTAAGTRQRRESFLSARASPHPGACIGRKHEKCAPLRKRDSLRALRSAPNQHLAINVGMLGMVRAT